MVRAFVDAQRVRKDYKPGWFEDVETELHKQMVEIERDLTAEIIAAHDVDAPVIEIAGKVQRRVLRAAQTYMTAAGPVTAERWLYRERIRATIAAKCLASQRRTGRSRTR